MGGQNWLTTVRRKAEGWGSPMSSGCGEWRNNRCKADGGRVVLTGGKDAMPGKLRQSVNRRGGSLGSLHRVVLCAQATADSLMPLCWMLYYIERRVKRYHLQRPSDPAAARTRGQGSGPKQCFSTSLPRKMETSPSAQPDSRGFGKDQQLRLCPS